MYKKRTCLKVMIVRSGRSQRDIAKAAGLGESKLSLFISGRMNPRSDEMDRIKAAIKAARKSA